MFDNPDQFLQSLPHRPGVYQMFNAEHKILYVGKAKDLKKRLRSYFYGVKEPKTIAFMQQVAKIEIIITENENGALLLEYNLIKTLRPHYNILFKDDKSFPSLFLSQHDFPRLGSSRNQKVAGRYFGPFPSGKAVNFTHGLLQKIFKLRVCSDSFFRNRTRPCMLHQLKLCTAPCVGKVNREEYAVQVRLAEQFLTNKSDTVVRQLTQLMDQAAAKLDYEQAAIYRDQITNLRKVQLEQSVTKGSGNCDILAVVADATAVCIEVLFVRNGLLLGDRSYFPTLPKARPPLAEIMSAFIIQHYLQGEGSALIPDKILLNIKIPDAPNIVTLLTERGGHALKLTSHSRGAQKQLVTMAETNAHNALATRMPPALEYAKMLPLVQQKLQLPKLPQRIECFDVSHTMGESQVAACVVFDGNGANKSQYRRFNITSTKGGDDYGALAEALRRRYRNLENLPDILMIDGGKGQLKVTLQVLQQLQIKELKVMAIAKGEERKPGLEEIYIAGEHQALTFPTTDPLLHFIQRIRDEAHRFALSGHRKQLAKRRRHSILEEIPGVGQEKRVGILRYFGGLEELRSAGVSDLAKVAGIGEVLAQRIYDYLHTN